MNPHLLSSDLVFNGLMLVIDAAAAGYLWRLRQPQLRVGQIAVTLLTALAAGFVLGAFVTALMGFRLNFGSLRYLGQTMFFHVPALLLALAWMHRARRPAAFGFGALGVALFGVYIYAYHIEPRMLQVTHYTYTHPLLEGLARPIKIAQVADVQTDHIGRYEVRVFERLAAEQPDLILYCGDYIHVLDPDNYAFRAGELRVLLDDVALEPPLGAFAVPGDKDPPNWDQALFPRGDAVALRDETVRLELPGGVGVNLIGLDLETSRSRTSGELRPAREGRDPHALDIYLGHAPDFVEAAAAVRRPFLAFAGHTHGGQVQIPFFGPPITYTRLPRRYADYYGEHGPGTLSVSRGIGMEREEAPRLRFLAPPELRFITLVPPGEIAD